MKGLYQTTSSNSFLISLKLATFRLRLFDSFTTKNRPGYGERIFNKTCSLSTSQIIKMSDNLAPSYTGILLSSLDAMVLFTLAVRNGVPLVERRPLDKERKEVIVSGNVFIYREKTSSIKRWTDGVTWSPSRIMGNFLVYRQLERGFPPGEKKRAAKRRTSQESFHSPSEGLLEISLNKEQERLLVGSLVDSYDFKPGGLIKKTISATLDGETYHLVSYYNLRHAVSGQLLQPSQISHIDIIEDLTKQPGFRIELDIQGNELPTSTRRPSRLNEAQKSPRRNDQQFKANDETYSGQQSQEEGLQKLAMFNQEQYPQQFALSNQEEHHQGFAMPNQDDHRQQFSLPNQEQHYRGAVPYSPAQHHKQGQHHQWRQHRHQVSPYSLGQHHRAATYSQEPHHQGVAARNQEQHHQRAVTYPLGQNYQHRQHHQLGSPYSLGQHHRIATNNQEQHHPRVASYEQEQNHQEHHILNMYSLEQHQQEVAPYHQEQHHQHLTPQILQNTFNPSSVYLSPGFTDPSNLTYVGLSNQAYIGLCSLENQGSPVSKNDELHVLENTESPNSKNDEAPKSTTVEPSNHNESDAMGKYPPSDPH
jgi:hypothetical protein